MSISLNSLFGNDDSDAEGYLQQALQQYQQLNVPTVASETVSGLPQETVQGSINPEQQQAVTQGDSALNDIHLDPSTRQAEISALGGYQDIANSGGLDASAMLGIRQAENAATVQSQGEQGAIQKQAEAEGQGGGLNALTLRSQAAQGASNTAATQGMEQAAEAEANREAALAGMSSIGNAVNASDYSQAANTAGSQNAINAANTATKNQVNASNVGNNLAAQGANVAAAQGVNASNTAAGQNQAYYNAQLPQQQFNNALSKASGMAGVNQQQAGVAQQAQQNGANATGQLLKGGLTLAGTALGGPIGGVAAGALASKVAPGTAGYAPPASANTQQYKPVGMAEGGAVQPEHQAALQDIINKYSGVDHVMGPENKVVTQKDPKTGHVTPIYTQMASEGERVPGKACVSGDSPKNDTVPAMLSPGEIVIKRSKAANPNEAAKEAKKISMQEFTKGYRKGK